jgi:hypothetical protein
MQNAERRIKEGISVCILHSAFCIDLVVAAAQVGGDVAEHGSAGGVARA